MGIVDLRPTNFAEWSCLCLASPFILLYKFIRIYVFGCLGVYASQAVTYLFCGVCICCNCGLYADKQFPPNQQSLGNLNVHASRIEWRRLGKLFERMGGAAGGKPKTKVQLFKGKIEPDDIKQGSVGDCWLMACLAAMARHPALLSSLLITKTYNAYGRYTVRLFSPIKNKWMRITVSDHIPVDADSNRPLFAAPNDSEAWVLLLEKACAKMLGSYAALDGNNPAVGLAMLTGQPVLTFGSKDRGVTWIKKDVVFNQNKIGEACYSWDVNSEKHGADKLFELLLTYKQRGALMICHCPGSDSDISANGMVSGHAYSVLSIKKVGSFRLVKLRNPWSTGEYTGAWSDSSSLWQQHPEVKAACKQGAKDDGAFWMSFEDWVSFFGSGNVDICSRSTGFNDLALDMHEEYGCCGPCCGCLEGCCCFWCGCKGCLALLFRGRQGTTETVNTDGGCCSGLGCCDVPVQQKVDKKAAVYKTEQFSAV